MENIYKHIVDTSPIGYAYHKITHSSTGVPLDFIYVETNHSFELLINKSAEDIIGKKGSEVLSEVDLKILEIFHDDSYKNLDNTKQTIIIKQRVKDQHIQIKVDFTGDGYFVVETTETVEDRFQQLVESEENYKGLFNRAPLGYQSLDINGYFIEVNEKWCDMLGYRRDEIIGKWFGSLVAPEYLEGFKKRFPKFKRQGHIKSEFEMLHKDGTRVFINFEGRIGYTEDREFKQTHCILRDITKEHKLEQALLENQYLMDSLMANTPDIIYIKDTNGLYMLFNKAAEELSGKKAVDILGKGVDAVFPPHIADKIMARDKEVLEKQIVITSEEIVLDTNGEFQTFLSTKGPIFDKNKVLIGMFGISRDINERIKWEKELRESERKYRWITDNIAEVISVYNITKKSYTFMSPSVYNLLGYTAEEVMSLRMNKFVSIDDYEVFTRNSIANYNDFMKDTSIHNHYRYEVQMINHDGEKIWTEVSTSYQENDNKEIESISIIRSIEERKKSEAIMEHLSYYDQLTGLYNRRFYEEELERIDIEENLPIALIMADLNGLKLANDAFGHHEGDLLLQKVSKILKKECSSNEIVSRIGGDEFVILMPKTDEEDVKDLLERINLSVVNERIKHGLLSISIGYAVKEKAVESIYDVFKKAEDEMYRHKLAESSTMRSKTIDKIIKSLYDKSEPEMMHSNRVSTICRAMGSKMELSDEEIDQLHMAGVLHDIGKIGIVNSILDKEDKLTTNDWEEIKKHCEVGYRILSSVNEYSEIAEITLAHHEHWDGNGYPQGLKGKQIPLLSRIVSVAEAFEAMVSDRPYSGDKSIAEASEELKAFSGTQFDPSVVEFFLEKVLPDLTLL